MEQATECARAAEEAESYEARAASAARVAESEGVPGGGHAAFCARQARDYASSARQAAAEGDARRARECALDAWLCARDAERIAAAAVARAAAIRVEHLVPAEERERVAAVLSGVFEVLCAPSAWRAFARLRRVTAHPAYFCANVATQKGYTAAQTAAVEAALHAAGTLLDDDAFGRASAALRAAAEAEKADA